VIFAGQKACEDRVRQRSLVHADHERIAAQTRHQPFSLGDQMHYDASLVLQPKIPRALSAVSSWTPFNYNPGGSLDL
jgi:hypothetical protein